MATKVGQVNNLLKIDNGTTVKYFNAVWCTLDFTSNTVTITDEGRGENNSVTIAFSDFQDLDSVSYNTEETIANYLSDKIA